MLFYSGMCMARLNAFNIDKGKPISHVDWSALSMKILRSLIKCANVNDIIDLRTYY